VLVDDLCRAASPQIIFKALEKLSRRLNHHATGGCTALLFVQANGLAALIRHLDGNGQSTRTTSSDITPTALSDAATEALRVLLGHLNAVVRALGISKAAISPLTDALCGVSSVISPVIAADVLTLLANANPAQCTATAEQGTLGLVFALYGEIGNLPLANQSPRPAEKLVACLVQSGALSATDFLPLIRAPESLTAFTALVILQV
jgi:hypothetical protein